MARLSFVDGGQYPRVTKRLDLGKYHPDLKGDYLEVWLNWDRAFNDRMVENNLRLGQIMRMPVGTEEEREVRDRALDEWIPGAFELNAEFWGCEVEEAQALYELDTELWRWVMDQANDMREAYREQRKKVDGSTRRS